MEKVYCSQCKHSVSENICNHKDLRTFGESYYKYGWSNSYQSSRNKDNSCNRFEKRNWLSQLIYDVLQYET